MNRELAREMTTRKIGDACTNAEGVEGTWQHNPDGWVCVVEPPQTRREAIQGRRIAAREDAGMSRYRTKPVVIEAFRMGVDNPPEWWWNWQTGQGAAKDVGRPGDGTVTIETLEGTMTVRHGDWIIRGINGKLYLCKPDIFAATYEPIEMTQTRKNAAPE